MRSEAVLSADGRYRYTLDRLWNESLPRAVFVMLNPSTADATVDDPTIRRCIGFARSWGCGALRVLNLYAFRATRPADLWLCDDPVGPENDRHIDETLAELEDSPLVLAWGANARTNRVEEVLSNPAMRQAEHLGLTQSGAPRHPLYLPSQTQRQRFFPVA